MEILMLRDVQCKTWKEIAAIAGRCVAVCNARYHELEDPQSPQYHIGPWSKEEEDRLAELRLARRPAREISKVLMRSVASVQAKIERGNRPGRAKVHYEVNQRSVAPQSALDDRNRRINAERDLTSMFFGDPAPGQSALDKKQGAFA